MTTWPGWELPDEYLPYVRRQSGLQSLQIRYESQRTNSLFSYRTRGRQTLGAGLGTIGEALSNWEIVAAATPALADIREPLAERARCVGGALVDRQTGTGRRRPTTTTSRSCSVPGSSSTSRRWTISSTPSRRCSAPPP